MLTSRSDLNDPGNGSVHGLPFFEQRGENGFAAGREAIEALVALVFLAPLAGEQALGFKAAQERVERAFLDLHAVRGQSLAKGVSVMLLPELGQNCEDQAAAAKLKAKIFKRVFGDGHTDPFCAFTDNSQQARCFEQEIDSYVGPINRLSHVDRCQGQTACQQQPAKERTEDGVLQVRGGAGAWLRVLVDLSGWMEDCSASEFTCQSFEPFVDCILEFAHICFRFIHVDHVRHPSPKHV